jgi:serine/threonine protein kinase
VQQAQLLPAPELAADEGGDHLQRQASEARDRMVAVKILRKELLEDPEQVQLFVREVALLRKLRHR